MIILDKIAVLIPCYNEAQTIERVVTQFKESLPGAVVYVYDNNSTDDTALLAQRAGAVVRREYTQGKGSVIRRGFREIDAYCYILTDGDDTYPAERAPDLARQVLEHDVDMVVGDRLSSTYFTENKRPFHNTGNRLVRAVLNRMYHAHVRDILTGYRAFSYDFVKTFPVLSTGFAVETEMTIHALDKNMRIENVIVDYKDRPAGSVSKLHTFSDGARVLGTIFTLYRNYRPLQFFGFFALMLALLAAIFLVPVFIDYFETGLVARFPTLIVGGFLGMGALQSFFSGLILSNLAQKDGRDFEMQLHRCRREKEEAKGL